jgi:hypothetical protein
MRFASSVLLLAACGYQSQYTAPADGRARVLWHDDHLSNNLPPLSDDCHQATWWLRHPAEQPPDRRFSVRHDVWVPVYYGADLVVVTPGVPPLLARPVLFSPSLAVAQAVAHSTPKLSLDKELAAVLMIVAIVVLPVVDITFAALHPEADSRSADAVDEVNAYNDLARSGGNPCQP